MLNLKDMLNERTIRAKVTAASWEEATDLVGGLLVQSGGVNVSYIDAMKRVKREVGPYMVIAPGIALLHARPEDGVISPCLAVVTLRQPVEFGHSENDPVDLVFGLGAVDKNGHVDALQQLASLLIQDGILTQIRDALTDESLLNVIKVSGEGLDKE